MTLAGVVVYAIGRRLRVASDEAPYGHGRTPA